MQKKHTAQMTLICIAENLFPSNLDIESDSSFFYSSYIIFQVKGYTEDIFLNLCSLFIHNYFL